jgi:hypothetical protein
MTSVQHHIPAPAKPGPIVYTDRQLLNALRRLTLNEPTIGRRTFDQRRRSSDPTSQLYERRFGSRSRALEIAGLATVEQPPHLQGATTKWTEQQILDALRTCQRCTGSTSVAAYEAWRTDAECPQTNAPPATTIRFRMRSWSRATQLAFD